MTIVNREQDLNELYDLVMARKNLLLYAPEGMGKTHLINKLLPRLRGRRICFYLNLRGLSSESQFLSKLIQSLQSSVSEHSHVNFQFQRFLANNPQHESYDLASLNKWIENLLVALQGISQDFLFIFEDLHQWEGKSEPKAFLAHFYRSRNSHILLTAYRKLEDYEKVQSVELKPLTPENLNAEFKADFYSEVAEELLQYTKGNTAFTMEMIEKNGLSREPLAKSEELFMEHYHSVFYNFRNRFTDLQWRLMRAISQEDLVPRPHSFNFLVKHHLGAASSVERALKNLSETGMIFRTEEGWKISNIIFQRWLQWLYDA